jgi:hypothetical protein
MKGNAVQTLHKATEALAFFPLAMQGSCILSILAMGELNGPLGIRKCAIIGQNYASWALVGPMGDR